MSDPMIVPTRRQMVLAGAAILTLAGCGSLLGPSGPPLQLYRLRPAFPAAGGTSVSWQLAVARPLATQSLDTERIALMRGAMMDYYADGWRWSPDGRSIAYWQLNANRVKNFDLVNNTDSLYSRVIPVQYPKAGEANSAARVGVVSAAGGPTRWLAIEGDPRNHYIARMDWAAGSNEVILQRLNRLQNTNEVMLGDARSGVVRTILTERDSAWVDVVDDLAWLKGGKSFLWVSERDGSHPVQLTSNPAAEFAPHFSPDGRWIAFSANYDNNTDVYVIDEGLVIKVELAGMRREDGSPARHHGRGSHGRARASSSNGRCCPRPGARACPSGLRAAACT